MAILDIVNAVRTQMLAIDPANTPDFEIGAAALNPKRSEPVVIWVPQGETITGARGQGGDGVSAPRPLYTRNVQVVAHLWDEDIPHVEALFQLVVQAVYAVGWGPTKPLHAQWQTGAEIVTNWGVLLGVAFEWQIPLVRQPDTFAVVTSMPITPAVIPPG